MFSPLESCLSVREGARLSPMCRSRSRLDIGVVYVAHIPQLANFCNHNILCLHLDTCPTYEREPGSNDE